jgi:integrase/recombinase XerD
MATTHSIVRSPSPETTFLNFSRYLYARRGLGEVTVSNHLSAIRRLAPRIGLKPTTRAIEGEIARMRKAGASYSHLVNTEVALERYMEFLGKPLQLGRPKKPRPLLRGTLSEAEVTLLIAAAHTLREKAIVSLLSYAGLRNRELCNLTIADVDLAGQMIHVHASKTQRDRNANVAGPCVAVLADYLRERNGQPHERLFVTLRKHEQYQPQVLRKLVRKLARRAGIQKRVYPHLLRHSLATNLLNRGANLLSIKEQLGHAFIDTTMIYLHCVPQRLQMEYRMYAPSYL